MTARICKTLLAGLIAAVVVAAAPAYADETLSAQAFTDAYVDAVRTAHPELGIEPAGPLGIDLVHPDGEKAQIGLDNAYRQYQSDPQALDDIIGRHVASIRFSAPTLDGATVKTIRPVIKSDDYMDHLRGAMQARGAAADDFPLPYTELAGDLNVLFVLDTETTMSTIDRQSADDMNLSTDDLLAVAVENLMAFFEDIQVTFEALETHAGGTILYLVADGNYEASAMLLDPVVAALDNGLRGDVVVFVPARDLFMATGTGEPGGIDAAAEVARRLYEESAYVISPHGYTRVDGRWSRLDR
ncbi:MAG: DUF1444 family protein [Woeseiaceae bacterium]|nr:DUF1444 family protein [Woeseiaceae bacterium]